MPARPGDAARDGGHPGGGVAPVLNFPPALLLQAQGIRAAIFDVDGVLTDGRIYIDADGETIKAFSTLDGQGLKLLRQGGIEPIVISGRDSAAVRRRVADLGLAHCAFGVRDKLATAEELLTRLGLAWDAISAMGDDWPDLPLLSRAAFACAPPHAHAEVRALAHHVTSAAAGYGAAREYCDLLLCAAGRYGALLAGTLATNRLLPSAFAPAAPQAGRGSGPAPGALGTRE